MCLILISLQGTDGSPGAPGEVGNPGRSGKPGRDVSVPIIIFYSSLIFMACCQVSFYQLRLLMAVLDSKLACTAQ